MRKQELPTRLVLCQRNPHGNFERILGRFTEPKCGQERCARGAKGRQPWSLLLQGVFQSVSSGHRRRAPILVKSKLVGVAMRSPCLIA